MFKLAKTACVGNNSITKTMHKTMHSTSLRMMRSSMQQKAGEEPGNKARTFLIPLMLCDYVSIPQKDNYTPGRGKIVLHNVIN